MSELWGDKVTPCDERIVAYSRWVNGSLFGFVADFFFGWLIVWVISWDCWG